MLKNLIILLIIVTLLAIGLNFDTLFSNKKESIQKRQVKNEVTINNVENKFKQNHKSITIIDENSSQKNEENLSVRIEKLLKKAHILFRNSKDYEAIEIYKKVIQQTINNKNPKIIEQFTKACMQMAFLYQIYPNLDKEMAIDSYDILINRFKDSNETKLLDYYITAKTQQSYLFDKDERGYVYDELIEKFENSKDEKLQKRVEELLINKSFELMGKDDEEAIDILDKIINKYQKDDERDKLPESVKLAILNNIELSIITSNNDEKYVDLANEYLSKSPDTKPILDMLDIIKNSQYLEQDDALAKWKEENREYHFDDWSFQEMKRWANQMEDEEMQERVVNSIKAFENQKYNRDKREHSTTLSFEKNILPEESYIK